VLFMRQPHLCSTKEAPCLKSPDNEIKKWLPGLENDFLGRYLDLRDVSIFRASSDMRIVFPAFAFYLRITSKNVKGLKLQFECTNLI
jgi:hypothetical protein